MFLSICTCSVEKIINFNTFNLAAKIIFIKQQSIKKNFLKNYEIFKLKSKTVIVIEN